jgi:hypothetical protein
MLVTSYSLCSCQGAHCLSEARNASAHHSADALQADQPIAGGDDRARTGNLRRARAMLSQLSYVPSSHSLVGPAGVEPATLPLSGARSNRS